MEIPAPNLIDRPAGALHFQWETPLDTTSNPQWYSLHQEIELLVSRSM